MWITCIKTMSRQCYTDLLLTLQESIKDERQGKLPRGVLLQQGNAPVHLNQVTMHAVCDRGLKRLPHPPYFLDLALSAIINLFSKLKKELRGRSYVHDDELTLEGFCRKRGSAFYR